MKSSVDVVKCFYRMRGLDVENHRQTQSLDLLLEKNNKKLRLLVDDRRLLCALQMDFISPCSARSESSDGSYCGPTADGQFRFGVFLVYHDVSSRFLFLVKYDLSLIACKHVCFLF